MGYRDRYRDEKPFEIFFQRIINGAILSFGLGAIATLICVMVYDTKDENAREAFRFKEKLFIAAAEKTERLTDYGLTEDARRDNTSSTYIGKYLLQEYKKGVPLIEITKPNARIRKMFDDLSSLSKENSKARLPTILATNDNMPWAEISMAQDWRWHRIVDNPDNIRALNKVLLTGQLPDMTMIDSVSMPWRWILLTALLFIQFVAYLNVMLNEDVPRLKIVPWRTSVKPYLTILILSPGALPLMAIHPGWTSLLKAFRTSWYQKEHSSPSIKNYKAGSCTSTQDLLKQLEARLENREGSAR